MFIFTTLSYSSFESEQRKWKTHFALNPTRSNLFLFRCAPRSFFVQLLPSDEHRSFHTNGHNKPHWPFRTALNCRFRSRSVMRSSILSSYNFLKHSKISTQSLTIITSLTVPKLGGPDHHSTTVIVSKTITVLNAISSLNWFHYHRGKLWLRELSTTVPGIAFSADLSVDAPAVVRSASGGAKMVDCRGVHKEEQLIYKMKNVL